MLKKLMERKKLIAGILLYWCFYLCAFFFVEKTVREPVLMVHCFLDDRIPYCRYMLVFYLLWFPFIAFTILYYVLFESEDKVKVLMRQLAVPMTLTLVWYLLVPNGTDVRSQAVLGTDAFSVIMELLWKTDPPTNVCPSIHVFVTLLLNHAMHTTSARNRVLETVSTVLSIGICASTLFLKQHSVIDVLAGIAVAETVLFISGKMKTEND